MQYFGTGRQGATQNITTSGTSAVVTNAFGAQTYRVRLTAKGADCWFRIGDGTPTATTGDTFMAAGSVEYFTCTPGQKVAAIQDSAAGTLNVTEVS